MKWRLIGGGAGVLTMLAGAGFFYWLNQPAVTVVQSDTHVKGAVTAEITTKPYANSYFSGVLPARFSNRTETIGKGQPIVLQQLFAAPADTHLYSDQLAITIGKLPSGGITEVADVQMRQRVADYTEAIFDWVITVGGVAYERNTDGYELGVFVPHDTFYAVFVVSGLPDRTTQLQQEMKRIVESLSWQ